LSLVLLEIPDRKIRGARVHRDRPTHEGHGIDRSALDINSPVNRT